MIFLVVMSLALLVPIYRRLFFQTNYVPGATLCVGTMLGAGAVFIGSAYASQWAAFPKRLFLSLWALFALMLAIGAGYGMLSTPNWSWRIALSLTALLPLAATGVFWIPRK
jgi:hypothetical protein